ncbi:unnamed protein product, partial [Effrenium voratum]
AWKDFLSSIQSGRGEVSEEVWQYIPEASSVEGWLAEPPTRKEFNTALSRMKTGKRGGWDDITAELIKFGGEPLQSTVFQIITDMWREAAEAGPGLEADTWCSSVKEGVCIPMFKNKGDRACKDNYRNLVMLSVAAKLVARIVASRLSAWIDVSLSEQQNGFFFSRGIDDAHQLVRRILEEVVVAEGDSRVCVTSFDIVRTYTRVCRDALWCLLSRLGAPPAFVQVLKALHEHTRFRVFVHNGYSSPWLTDRGLREGCPSSPVLFNIFHDAVLITFRTRRAERALVLGLSPGLPWRFKVDGHLTRRPDNKLSSRGARDCVLGDVEYADDSLIVAQVDEASSAESTFIDSLRDWGQEEHPGKRERLVVCPRGRGAMEVLEEFECRTLKHLGTLLSDKADLWPETKRRFQAGFFAVRRVAKLWSLGSHRGRGSTGGLSTCRKLKVMRAVIEGTVLACGKTRVWSSAQERKIQQVLSRAVRRSLGLDVFNMREYGYSDEGLLRMVHWDPFPLLLHRQVLHWAGHVARMPVSRLPKIALFGWPVGLERHSSGRSTYPMWVKWLLLKYGISTMDWFRLAQKPTGQWLKLVRAKLPRTSLPKDKVAALNAWKPGQPLLWQEGCAPPHGAARFIPEETLEGLPPNVDLAQDISGEWPCPACRSTTRPTMLDTLWALPASPEMPNFVGRSVTGWELNTDGSGASDEGPHAGWGIAVWVEGVRSVLPEFELFGPVPLQSWEPRWMGADIASNNVGELTAMLEALLWLEQEAPGDAGLPARIRFDSTYAH